MNKNDMFELTIEDMTNEGEGIGHIQNGDDKGIAVFVKDAIIGDTIKVGITKVKKNYAYGRVVEIIEPSPDRVKPECEVFKRCGGCILQHMDYASQLEFKKNKVVGCLERIGGIKDAAEKLDTVCGMENPWNYRNKAQFPVGYDGTGKLVTGFYAGRTHDIIPCMNCRIQAPVNESLLQLILSFMEEEKITAYNEVNHTGLVRHILTRVGFTTGEIMVCIIINGTKLPHSEKLIEKLANVPNMTSISININTEKTNRILGDTCKTLWGQDYITDYIGDIKYQISPMSFYQVNPVQTTKLYSKALEYAGLEGNETVWDLYCGIGTISLFLAQKAKKVYGVEIIPQAIDDARNNASINNLSNAEFFVGKAEEVLPSEYKTHGVYADVIVVDPPRKGCDETLLKTIIEMAPRRMVYVSCDPATLARDIKYMTANDYNIEKFSVYDQFCHSSHVETVCLLSRKAPV